MSSYDYDPDEPTGAAEAADFKAWRAQRDAEAEARKPKVIDYANSEDPKDEALKIGKKVIADGGTEMDGMAAHFAHLARAAMQNDRRVVWDPRNEPRG